MKPFPSTDREVVHDFPAYIITRTYLEILGALAYPTVSNRSIPIPPLPISARKNEEDVDLSMFLLLPPLMLTITHENSPNLDDLRPLGTLGNENQILCHSSGVWTFSALECI